MKLDFGNEFQMTRSWIDNTMRWLQKKAIEKSKAKKKSLQVKLHKLMEEKQLSSELLLEVKKNEAMNQPDIFYCLNILQPQKIYVSHLKNAETMN